MTKTYLDKFGKHLVGFEEFLNHNKAKDCVQAAVAKGTALIGKGQYNKLVGLYQAAVNSPWKEHKALEKLVKACKTAVKKQGKKGLGKELNKTAEKLTAKYKALKTHDVAVHSQEEVTAAAAKAMADGVKKIHIHVKK